ncbi:hypothetical protein [Promicromonospora soli]
MSQANWLVKGSTSERWIVTAPGAPTGVAKAVEQLDAALDGFSGNVPGWFRAVKKTGSWWYLICVVIAVVVVVAVAPVEIGMRIAIGISAGLFLAVLSGPLLRLLATAQSRAAGVASADRVIADVAGTARPIQQGVVERATAVIDNGAAPEDAVHALVWRAAQGSSDEAAAAELLALWRKAAPEQASAHQARMEQYQAQLGDQDKR